MKLLNMTMDDVTLALDEIINMQTEASNLIGHIQYRNKRSLLPLGGLFGFLFGRADQADLDALRLMSDNYTRIRWTKQMF